MKRTAIVAFLLTATFGANFAAAQATPFVGVVTGDDVYVRSGPSQSYYDIAKANTGDIVRVVDLMHSWYVIEAPQGTYSYIAKQYVELAGDGKTGTVTGNRVRVRAPSKAGPTIEQSYKSQLKLDRGATVEVLGEAGSFYKIVPPQGAMAYIHSDYVREATPGEIAAARQPAVEADPAVAEAAEQAVESVTDDGPAEVRESPATDATAGRRTATGESADAMQGAGTATATRAAETPEAESPTAGQDITEPRADRVEPAAEPATDAATTSRPTADVRDPIEADRTAATGTGNMVTVTGTSDDYAARTAPPAPPTDARAQPTESPAIAETVETVEAVDIADTTPADRSVDEQLAELEAAFARMSNQPLADQPVDRMLTEYKSLKRAGGLDEQSRVLVDTRIELLEARGDLQETLSDLAEARERAAAEKPTMANYDAMGRLIASTLYTGDRLPLLYRLVDPLTGLTVGYVEPAEDVDLTPLLGRVVGVEGQTRFHPGLKLRVITVSRADALTAAE